jgi:hypothetical protein
MRPMFRSVVWQLVHGQSGGMPWLRCGALPFEHEQEHEHEHEQPISQQPLASPLCEARRESCSRCSADFAEHKS